MLSPLHHKTPEATNSESEICEGDPRQGHTCVLGVSFSLLFPLLIPVVRIWFQFVAMRIRIQIQKKVKGQIDATSPSASLDILGAPVLFKLLL